MKYGSLSWLIAIITVAPAFAQSSTKEPTWRVAPRETQIIEDRPILRDFREAPSAPSQVLVLPRPLMALPINDALPPPDPRCYPYSRQLSDQLTTPDSAYTGTTLRGFPGRDPKTIYDAHFAAREIQIIDDRPIIRDFREAPKIPGQIKLPPAAVEQPAATSAPIYYDALPPRDPRCYPHPKSSHPYDDLIERVRKIFPQSAIPRSSSILLKMPTRRTGKIFDLSGIEQEAAAFRKLTKQSPKSIEP